RKKYYWKEIRKDFKKLDIKKYYKYLNKMFISKIVNDKEVQITLSKDESDYVRRNLALNPSINKELQIILSKDENSDVRIYLASNPSIDKELQMILVKDNNIGVRRYLALNKSIDKEVQ